MALGPLSSAFVRQIYMKVETMSENKKHLTAILSANERDQISLLLQPKIYCGLIMYGFLIKTVRGTQRLTT